MILHKYKVSWLKIRSLSLIILPFAILVVTSLACNMPVNVPTPPAAPIIISTEAVSTLKADIIDAAGTASAGGDFHLEMSETQITSLVAAELARRETLPLSEPQVYLRNGQLQFFGMYQQEKIFLPVSVQIHPSIDEQNKLAYKVEGAYIGQLPLPNALLEQITTILDELVRSQINSSGRQVHFTAVSIVEGILLLDGKLL